jgi:cyclopropane fatty-acyl-phospholipid synthase-like methyltransferase
MPNEKAKYPKFSYDAHARTCAADDFFGQICRTVQGKPVSDDQLQILIAAIKSGLVLKPNDVLLELACGNGAVSQFFFDSCQGYLGVDISEHLVSIAKKNFEVLPHYQFAVQSAVEYVRQEQRPERFTKILCCAGFQYFPDEDADEVLSSAFKIFSNVQTIFIGSLPDKDRAGLFYKSKQPSTEELLDCSTAIGIWRTKEEFEKLAVNAGWTVEFPNMHEEYYASYYRYNALLRR